MSLPPVSTGAPPTPTLQSCPSRRSRLSGGLANVHTSPVLPSTASTKLAEDDALDQITKEAEARLAARRQARAEAREIRLREMERQQRELEETADRHYELLNSGTGSLTTNSQDYLHRQIARANPLLSRESRTASYASSRRSSQESLEYVGSDSARELRHYVQELEEKFRKAMISNAQLDNEKQSFTYQVDLNKDEMEELEENYLRIQRDCKDKSRNLELLKRDHEKLKFDFRCYKEALEERDRIIKDAGLVIIRNSETRKSKLLPKAKLVNGMINGDTPNGVMCNGLTKNGNIDDDDHDEEEDDDEEVSLFLANNISLISKEAATMLEDIPGNTLEAKLVAIFGENRKMASTIKELTSELEEERQRFQSLNDSLTTNSVHLTSEMQAEIQREANKMTNDLRYKLKKSEQEVAALSTSVARLETQVARFKTATEEAEKLEEELKSDKRKAQRELREAQTRIDELESANAHLQKRIDKLKSNRNILGIIANASSACNSSPSTPSVEASVSSTPLGATPTPPPSTCSDTSTICSTTSTFTD